MREMDLNTFARASMKAHQRGGDIVGIECGATLHSTVHGHSTAVISAWRFAGLAESLAKSAIANASAPNARAIEVPMPGPTPATMTTGFIVAACARATL